MWITSVASRVCITYPAEEDRYGHKVRLLVAEPRVRPDGTPTGNEDTLWIYVHLPERYTGSQMDRFSQAKLLKKGDWFRWAGNLHTSYSKELGSFAYVSCKDIETPYHSSIARNEARDEKRNPLLDPDDWIV